MQKRSILDDWKDSEYALNLNWYFTNSSFTYSMLTTETLEQSAKHFQSYQ